MTTLRRIAQPSDCFLTHMLLAYWRKLLRFNSAGGKGCGRLWVGA
jgi:hypothetical protein